VWGGVTVAERTSGDAGREVRARDVDVRIEVREEQEAKEPPRNYFSNVLRATMFVIPTQTGMT